MPDREKVIKGLDVCLKNIDQSDCPNDCPYLSDCSKYENRVVFQPLMRDALALLKDQEEPKHIIRKQCKKEWEDGSIDYYAEWYCPHCNSLILRGFDNPSIKFCYKCGKPILWEGR